MVFSLGIPIASQHLLFQGTELDEESCLHDFGITHGSTLKLVLGMRGGPINTRRIPTEPEPADVAAAAAAAASGGKHVTLLVFREGDQLNFFRVVDRGDGTLTPLAESLSASSRHDSNGEMERLPPATSATTTVPSALDTTMSDSDDDANGTAAVGSDGDGGRSTKQGNEEEQMRNKMRQLQFKMDQVRLSRKTWNRKASRLQPLQNVTSLESTPRQPQPPSDAKFLTGGNSVRNLPASLAFGGIIRRPVLPQPSFMPLPPSLPPMPPPEVIPLGSSSLTTSSALATSTTVRLLSGRDRLQPSAVSSTVAASDSAAVAAAASELLQKQMAVSSTSKTNKKRCHHCGKKTGLATSYSCRCGNNFCSRHRYAELHACAFDYKSEGRLRLQNTNPLVQASKLPKI